MASKIEKQEKVIAIIVIGFLLFVFGYFSLGNQTGQPQQQPNNENTRPYIPATLNQLPSENNSGFVVFDQQVGNGDTPKEGDSVRIHYTGVLEDGSIFDSSLLRNETFDFTLGTGSVIPGFEIAVLGMREGGTRLVRIPPELAYGSSPNHSLSDSTLYFELVLVEILDGE